MIERKFIAEKLKETQVQDFVASYMENTGYGHIEIKRTPLGEKIIIYTTKPGLLVGRKGENIREMTAVLKKKFQMENPQIEIAEIDNPLLDPNAVADQIKFTFNRFGPRRFKFMGYNMLTKIMNAGALGAEIVIGGRGVPGSRAKSWRFTVGHLKKSGDVSENMVLKAKTVAQLKSGAIGIKVSIMHPSTQLPDRITLIEKKEPEVKDKKEPEIKEKKETEVKEKKETEVKEKKKNGNIKKT